MTKPIRMTPEEALRELEAMFYVYGSDERSNAVINALCTLMVERNRLSNENVKLHLQNAARAAVIKQLHESLPADDSNQSAYEKARHK